MKLFNYSDFIYAYTNDCKLYKINAGCENQRPIDQVTNCTFMRANDEFVTDSVYLGSSDGQLVKYDPETCVSQNITQL